MLLTSARLKNVPWYPPRTKPEVSVGDEIEVYVERLEDLNGQAVLSAIKPAEKKHGAFLKHHLKNKSVLPV